MSENQNKVSQAKYALAAFLSVVVFIIIYKFNLTQLLTDEYADIKDHLAHAQGLYWETFWESWLKRPYPMWHMAVKGVMRVLAFPANEAACFVSGVFAMLCYLITFFIIDKVVMRLSGKDGGIMAAGVSAMLSLVTALYVPWYNAYHHEGQFSINPFFNPTHMAVKPFGLLAFIFAIDLIRRYHGMDTIFCTGKMSRKWLYVLFSAALFLSAFTKPTFMYMLLPAGVIYLLIELVINLIHKDGSWKRTWSFMWRIACACIPALVYLLFEYAAFYFWGGTNEDASIAIYPFLTAWKLYAPNVLFSLFLGMSFPIWMVVTNFKYFVQSVEGRLSLLGYVVGALEFSFFVETGDKLGHLNFSWPMMSGMLLIWVIAAAKLVEQTVASKPGKASAVKVTVGWMLLAFHLFCGLYYINPYQYII